MSRRFRNAKQTAHWRGAVAVAGALILFGAASLEAQRTAVPRGGGGGSRSAPSASSGSHRPSGGGAAPRTGSGSHYRPHRPPGRDHYVRPSTRYWGPRHYWGYPSYPYYYYWGYPYYWDYPSRYWLSFNFGYPYYYDPYRAYPPPRVVDPAPYYARDDSGALSLKVRPKNAEVWVDGRYLGAAKSFDGTPRYLWLPPGTYHLVLYSPGYANFESDVEVAAGEVLKFDLRLEEGVAQRPVPQRYAPDEDYFATPPTGAPEDAPLPGQADELDARPRPGRLQLDVRPADASVYVDGRFVGTGRDVSGLRAPLLVDPGEHVIQVIHPDYESREVGVEIESGGLEDLEIALEAR